MTRFYTDKKGRKRPISEKRKSKFHSQTEEPSWKKSSLDSLKPQKTKVVRKRMTENIAEISRDGKTIYVDKSVSKEDLPPIIEHEKEYWHLRYEHKLSREDAIKGAVVHERQYVESHGGSWEEYNLRMANTERAIQEGGNPHKKYLYSTIHRGKVKVTSPKQHRLLEGRKLPHTHVYRTDEGEIVRKRVNVD